MSRIVEELFCDGKITGLEDSVHGSDVKVFHKDGTVTIEPGTVFEGLPEGAINWGGLQRDLAFARKHHPRGLRYTESKYL
jgi:hypothetical protein